MSDAGKKAITASTVAAAMAALLKAVDVYVMNHAGNTGNGFFGKAFVLFHLPTRTNTMQAVSDVLYYVIGGCRYADYYLCKGKSRSESKALSLQDVISILHSVEPVIRDVVSEKKTITESRTWAPGQMEKTSIEHDEPATP